MKRKPSPKSHTPWQDAFIEFLRRWRPQHVIVLVGIIFLTWRLPTVSLGLLGLQTIREQIRSVVSKWNTSR